MQDILDKQKAYFIKNGPPSYDLRIDRLDRMKTLELDLKTSQWLQMFTQSFLVLSMQRKI